MTETKTPNQSGPERLTIPERVIRLIHLPYIVGCLLVAVVAGGPGSFLVFYLGNFNLDDALRKTVSVSVLSISPASQQIPVTQGAAEIVVFTLSLFVDMYLTRYLRLKVLAAEPKLSPLSPGGGAVFRRAFGLVSNAYGPLLFALIFFLLYFPSRATIAGGPVPLVGTAVLSSINNVVYGTAFWVYLSGLWGVYRFGLEPLNLKRFYEDRMLGLRPLGQLVVSFALIFSGAITTTLGGSLIAGDVGSIAVNLGIVALGVAMLFLPLIDIHKRMVEVKEEEEGKLSLRSKDLLAIDRKETTGDQRPLSTNEALVELQRFQALRAEASRISEWPFETRSVERLIGILLAIFTVLLARFLQVA